MRTAALLLTSLAGCKDTFYLRTVESEATDLAPTDEVPTDVAPTDGGTTDTGTPTTDRTSGLHTGAAGHSGSSAHSAVGTTPTGDTGLETTPTGDTGPVGLPDPRTGMDPGFCAGQPYYNPAAPTATRYYAGDFTVGGGNRVTGVETMQLFFNPPAAAAVGASECVVTWATTGSTQAPGACRTCTTGLDLLMQVDPARTDCPPYFYSGSASFRVDYDVDAAPNHESTFTFWATGTYLGRWYWENTRYTYLSDPSCWIF